MTPRQQRFVDAYARSRNAAEAAREAGYSPFNAAVRGAQLLRTKGVAEGLRALGIEVPQGGTRAASFCKNAAGLTERQQRFVEQYMILGNASEAARRAGYSTVTAKSAGSQLVRSPRIVAALEAGNAARAERTRLDGDRVLLELARLGYVDLRAFFEWRGDQLMLKPVDAIAPQDWAALSEVTLVTGKDGTRLRVKVFDKIRALTLLAKHFGLLKPVEIQKKPWEGGTPDGRSYKELLRERVMRLVPKERREEEEREKEKEKEKE